MEAIRTWSFLAVATLGLVICSSQSRAEQDFDRERYYRAVEYCRGDVSRPMELSPDGKILCFDGKVTDDLDTSLARDLKEEGLFVAQKLRGNSAPGDGPF